MDIGVVGLGRIGGGLARQAVGKGIRVVGYDTGVSALEGVEVVSSLREMGERLGRPRRVFLYVPAGDGVDRILAGLGEVLSPEDVVVDGGNSYWGDSRARAAEWAGQFRFLDMGTSGGLAGATSGACFMVGGARVDFEYVEPVLRALAVEGGVVYCGGAGCGHFVKLVHNGVEFGMLQAIGEGVQLLEAFDGDVPVGEVLEAWRHGSVVRSWLVDLMAEGYREHGELGAVPDYIEDTGEVNWLVGDALDMEVPVPVISLSVTQLLASRDRGREWARAVAVMRRGFGGHPLGADSAVAQGRRSGRRSGRGRDCGDKCGPEGC